MVRVLNILQLAVLFLAPAAWTNPITCTDDIGPTNSAASFQQVNTAKPMSQINILGVRASSIGIEARQASCPNPSTNSLCKSNFCFIYQPNSDGTAWATCCPAGWSLQLNAADWSSQKCVLGGVSEAPLRPVSCGGSINGSPGTISGWACVYSSQNVNGVGKVKPPHLLVTALALAIFGIWVF